MRVRILASATDRSQQQFLTTFLINDVLAIDAGCLGLSGTPDDQARVSTVFLTHSHADHVCSLPMFLLNVSDSAPSPILVYGHPHALESLRTDMFNGRVWPNFLNFSRGGSPFVTLKPLASHQTIAVNGLRITPVPVDHVVPTFGYLVDDGAAAVAFSTDSGPTSAIWELARTTPHLKGVFMGVAFPDEFPELATVSGHLTPALCRKEAAKLPGHSPIVAVHIKATYRARVVDQLNALKLPNLQIGVCGREYAFS